MKVYFENLDDKLHSAIEIIKGDLGIEVSSTKRCVKLSVSVEEAAEHTLSVKLCGKDASITYGGGAATFLRGLAMLCKWVRDGKSEGEVNEKPFFHVNGAMVDMSRNAVMKPETVKFMMRKMALMGLNCYMLYTEDTYEIEGRPYFGYMRGRYTKEELRELDAYALSLGIELIPCIQTLGHMATHLKWPAAGAYKDTSNCLLVGADATYTLISDMLKTAKECFTTNRIHIGMDETIGLGTGRYKSINGIRPMKDIFLEHLSKVAEMCDEYGLKPMIWSDMIIEIAAEGLEKPRVYDPRAVITEELKAQIPKNVQLVFWDYYNTDESFYAKNIANHKKLCDNTMFGGAVWCWSGFAPVFSESFRNTMPALHACREADIHECLCTIWHNGSENSLILSLAGLAWYADYGYKCEYNEESMKECFAFATGEDYDAFAATQDVERPDGGHNSLARALVYGDPLCGLFDRHFKNVETDDYYRKTTAKLNALKVNDPTYLPAFEIMRKLSSLLENKASFGIRAKAAYDAGDMEALAALREECKVIREKAILLKNAHRDAWMTYNKPFGFEIMDIRYGGVIARIETAEARLSDYVSGKVDSLPELEEERLRMDCVDNESDKDLITRTFLWRSYQAIASMNVY